jgi:hypothetical protein
LTYKSTNSPTTTKSDSSRPLIERQKRQMEQAEVERRKIALLRSILSHFIGIYTAVVELYLGYKVDFKDRR